MANIDENAYSLLYIREFRQIQQYSPDELQWKNIVWPMEILNWTKVILTSDLNFTDKSSYFILDGSQIIFDGMYNNIWIKNTSDYLGLFKTNPSCWEIQIRNINIKSSNSNLFPGSGWLAQSGFGFKASQIEFLNCSSSGPIDSIGSAGIIGAGAGNKGTISISNCYSTGLIGSVNTAGIVGSGSGTEGSISIFNCYSTGEIAGIGCGGICGSDSGISGIVSINSCYSTGQISGSNCGGIYGLDTNTDTVPSGTIKVINTYSSGAIKGTGSGGIFPMQTQMDNKLIDFCYVGNGEWSDTDASQTLLNVYDPEKPNMRIYWFSIGTNKPYLLASFVRENYKRNFMIRPTSIFPKNTLVTSPGVFSGRKYYIVRVQKNNFSSGVIVSIDQNMGEITFSNFTDKTLSLTVWVVSIGNLETNSEYSFSKFYINPSTANSFSPKFGTVDTIITIEGDGFNEDTQVKIANIPCEILPLQTPTKIQVKAPKSLEMGRHQITVTSAYVQPLYPRWLSLQDPIGIGIANIFIPNGIYRDISTLSTTRYSLEQLQLLNPSDRTREDKLAHRQLVIQTLFDIYDFQNKLVLPASAIYIPNQILSESKTVSIFNGLNSSEDNPLEINVGLLGSSPFAFTISDNSAIKFVCSGKYLGYVIYIRKSANGYLVIKSFNNTPVELKETDEINDYGIKILLNIMSGQVTNLADTSNLPIITAVTTRGDFPQSESLNTASSEIEITGDYFYSYPDSPLELYINGVNVTDQIISINLSSIIFTAPVTEPGSAKFRIVTLGGEYTNYIENEITNELFIFHQEMTITKINPQGVPNNQKTLVEIEGTGFYGDVNVWLATETEDFSGIFEIKSVSPEKITGHILPTYYVGTLVLVVKTKVSIVTSTIVFTTTPTITKITDLANNQIKTCLVGTTQNIYLIGKGLTGTKTIKFNEISVPDDLFIVISDELIQMVTPKINELGPVEIYVETFASSTSNNLIWTYVNASPTVESVKTDEPFGKTTGSKLGNQVIVITGTNFFNSESEPIYVEINGVDMSPYIVSVDSTKIKLVTLETNSGSVALLIRTTQGIYKNFNDSKTITTELFYFMGTLDITRVEPAFIPTDIPSELTIYGNEFYGNVWVGLENQINMSSAIKSFQVLDSKTIIVTVNPSEFKFVGSASIAVRTPEQLVLSPIEIFARPEILSVNLVGLPHPKIANKQGGNKIKITGHGFAPIPGRQLEIKINGTTCTIISVTSTEIITRTPQTTMSGPATFYLNIAWLEPNKTSSEDASSTSDLAVNILSPGSLVNNLSNQLLISQPRTSQTLVPAAYEYVNYIESNGIKIVQTNFLTFAGTINIESIEPAGILPNELANIVVTGTDFYGDVEVWFANDFDDYNDILTDINVEPTQITATINPTNFVGRTYLIVKTDIDTAAKVFYINNPPKILGVTNLLSVPILYGFPSVMPEIYLVGTGFYGIKVIKFNENVINEYTVESNEKIKLTQPTNLAYGPVNIYVETYCGNNLSDTIYKIGGVPTVSRVFVYQNTGILTTFANANGNQEITIIGSSFTGTGQDKVEVTINGKKIIPNLIEAEQIKLITQSTNSGSMKLQITNSFGSYKNYSDSDLVTTNLLTFVGKPEITSIIKPASPNYNKVEVTVKGKEFYGPIDAWIDYQGVKYDIISDITLIDSETISIMVGPASFSDLCKLVIANPIDKTEKDFAIVMAPQITKIVDDNDVTLFDIPLGVIKTVYMIGDGYIGLNLFSVTVGDANAEYTIISPTKLAITLPDNLTLGNLVIKINTHSGTSSININIVRAIPFISSIDTTGSPNRKISISTSDIPIKIIGTNFVSIGKLVISGVDVTSSIISYTLTEIIFANTNQIPSGLATIYLETKQGAIYKNYIENEQGKTITTNLFTWANKPTISLITPQKIPNNADTQIIISGTEFYGYFEVILVVSVNGSYQYFHTVSNVKIINDKTIEATVGPTNFIGGVYFFLVGELETLINVIEFIAAYPEITSVDTVKSITKKVGNKLGQDIKITGTNLDNLIKLEISGITINKNTITSSNSTEIILTTPQIANSGPATFYLETAGGIYKNYTESDGIITVTKELFNWAGYPTITSISPIGAPLNSDIQVTITGTEFYPGISIDLNNLFTGNINHLIKNYQVVNPNTIILDIKTTDYVFLFGFIIVNYKEWEQSTSTVINYAGIFFDKVPVIKYLTDLADNIITSFPFNTTQIKIVGDFVEVKTIEFNGISIPKNKIVRVGYNYQIGYTWQVDIPSEIKSGPVSIKLESYGGITTTTFTLESLIPSAPIITSVNTLSAVYPNIANKAGGTVIKINGTGFTGLTVLKINGVQITPDLITPTEITLSTVTTSDGSAKFYIETPGGTYMNYTGIAPDETVTTKLFVFADKPTITSITPLYIQTNVVNTITIVGTGFYDETVVTLNNGSQINYNQYVQVKSISPNTIVLELSQIELNDFYKIAYFNVGNYDGTGNYSLQSVTLYAGSNGAPTITSVENSSTKKASANKINNNILNIIGTNLGPPVELKINGVNQLSRINSWSPNLISVYCNSFEISGQATFYLKTPEGLYQNYIESNGSQTITTNLFGFYGYPTITSVTPERISNNTTSTITISGTEFFGNLQVYFKSSTTTYSTITDILANSNGTTITATISPTSFTGTIGLYVITDIGQVSKSVTLVETVGSVITSITDGTNIISNLHVTNSTQLYISGVGLSGVTGVKLNNSNVGFTYIASTGRIQIEQPSVIVPGPVNITVQLGSTSINKANAFVYLPNPIISTITPSSAILNTITNVTINGSGFANLLNVNSASGFEIKFGQFNGSGIIVQTNASANPPDTVTVTVPGITTVGPVTIQVNSLGSVFTFNGLFNIITSEILIPSALYIKQDIGDVPKSKLGLDGSWVEISWPFLFSSTVTNIFFTTDLTLTGINQYFVIGANQQELNGNSHKVTISGVTGYNGLVKNGDPNLAGFSNTTVKNIGVESVGSTLASNSGWVCQNYYSYEALNNKIINCYSTGNITNPNSGGIVGYYAAASNSTAVKNEYASIYVSNCWSSGNITGRFSGGIFASYAGKKGKAYATNCFSTGSIGSPAVTGSTVGQDVGGIFGYGPGSNSGLVTATDCYSRGAINGKNCGGIIGSYIANAVITNCYSLGRVIGTAANSANGFLQSSGTIKIENFYGADGSWSVYIANENLTGYPSGSETIGTTWTSVGISSPYILTSFNNSTVAPKNFTNAITTARTFSTQSFEVKNKTYQLLNVIDSFGNKIFNFSIGSTTGIITGSNPGQYTASVVIFENNNSSYSVEKWKLNIIPQQAKIVKRLNWKK